MTIQKIRDDTICRGSCYNPQFTFINEDRSIPDYSEYTGYYILSPYGYEDENILSITMELTDTNIFTAILNSEDTDLEEGTYTVKIVLVDNDGNQYKPCRGTLSILKDTLEVNA